MPESPCDGPEGGCIVPQPQVPSGRGEGSREPGPGLVWRLQDRPTQQARASRSLVRMQCAPVPIAARLARDHDRRMDAKQVWRAALGELQVSLSPANFETWLRDTQLVDVDEQRFRIAVPNGFAKDWLETRYRSLISQTLAR